MNSKVSAFAPPAPISSTNPPLDVTPDGSFSGYGAVFGNLDLNGDVIQRGTFAMSLRALRERQQRTQSVALFPLLWQHEEAQPIGYISDAREDGHGLHIRGRIDLDAKSGPGQRAYSGMKLGYPRGLSIGFRLRKSTFGALAGKSVRILTDIDLFEVSVVSLPANVDALVGSVKAQQQRDREWKRACDDMDGLLLDRRQAELEEVLEHAAADADGAAQRPQPHLRGYTGRYQRRVCADRT